jgi:hypothetical protein
VKCYLDAFFTRSVYVTMTVYPGISGLYSSSIVIIFYNNDFSQEIVSFTLENSMKIQVIDWLSYGGWIESTFLNLLQPTTLSIFINTASYMSIRVVNTISTISNIFTLINTSYLSENSTIGIVSALYSDW